MYIFSICTTIQHETIQYSGASGADDHKQFNVDDRNVNNNANDTEFHLDSLQPFETLPHHYQYMNNMNSSIHLSPIPNPVKSHIFPRMTHAASDPVVGSSTTATNDATFPRMTLLNTSQMDLTESPEKPNMSC